jgi:hypothetical protein
MPSRSSRLEITLKPPTQTQKPSRAPRAIYKDKDLDSDIESEDDHEDDHFRDGGGKRPLSGFMFFVLSRLNYPVDR